MKISLKLFILSLTFILSQLQLFGQDEDSYRGYLYMPRKDHFIEISGSYLHHFFNDHLKFETGSEFQADSKNDSYEAEGPMNYCFALNYKNYLGQQNLAFFRAGVEYSKRNANFDATMMWRTRDPATMDMVDLIIASNIKSQFTSLNLRAGLGARLEIIRNLYLYSGLEGIFGYVLNQKDVEYNAGIMEMVDPDGNSVPTTITFSNGTQKLKIDGNHPDFTSGHSSQLVYGIKLSFGGEWFISDRIGFSLEISGSKEFSNYFNAMNGSINSYQLGAGILFGI